MIRYRFVFQCLAQFCIRSTFVGQFSFQVNGISEPFSVEQLENSLTRTNEGTLPWQRVLIGFRSNKLFKPKRLNKGAY